MALIELKSDLSWYGSKSPGPYTPNPSVRDSKIDGAQNGVPFAMITGYDNFGMTTQFRRAEALDGFPFNQGDAKRLAQLGGGTKFPIGPAGQKHKFDQVRFGFNSDNRYGDVYGGQTNEGDNAHAGLSKTYTDNSPIEDMYNTFNLRDDATPNPSYAKQPFILRGIQREGKSKNQRWGLGDTFAGKLSSTLDLPRGGILTNVERTVIDALRIGKFLISPRGLGFMTRQIGYQLMNPVPNTRLWNPLSLGSIAPMVHINRHVGAGFLEKKMPKLLGALGGGLAIESRLEKLLVENITSRELTIGKKVTGEKWKTLSQKIGGPGSILGIGGTDYFKYSDTNFQQQTETGLLLDTWQTDGDGYHRWGFGQLNYVQTRGEGGVRSWEDIESTDGLKTRHTGEWPTINLDRGGTGTTQQGGGKAQSADSDNTPINLGDVGYYKTLEYGDLKRDASAGIIKSFQAGSTYETTDSLTSKYGYPDYPLGEREDAVDPIQSIEAFSDYGDIKDLIKFKFTPLRLTATAADTQSPIIFRAFINTLSDSFMPSWEENQDQGRADAKIMYNGWGRNISLDFIVPIFSRGELEIVYNKLDELAKLTYPIYQSSGFTGTYCKVTIGDLYDNIPMYVVDLSFDWDNETPWELEDGKQVPYYTNVSMTLGWIGTQRPEYNTKVFSLNGTA